MRDNKNEYWFMFETKKNKKIVYVWWIFNYQKIHINRNLLYDIISYQKSNFCEFYSLKEKIIILFNIHLMDKSHKKLKVYLHPYKDMTTTFACGVPKNKLKNVDNEVIGHCYHPYLHYIDIHFWNGSQFGKIIITLGCKSKWQYLTSWR